jgi:putative component of membrane protein insertase Oxa1/YidC/SpoIIIJ protein YidD
LGIFRQITQAGMHLFGYCRRGLAALFWASTKISKELFVAGMLLVRPLLGPPGCCCYAETCTAFARRQLATRFFPIALVLIAGRVLSCNPLAAYLYRSRLWRAIFN